MGLLVHIHNRKLEMVDNLLRTVIMMEVLFDPLRLAVQVYCPAWDVAISLSVRSLETTCPLVMGSPGVGVTPGPSHWKSGVPVTPVGRVTEQVRVTLSPAMMGEEGEEVREMVVPSIQMTLGMTRDHRGHSSNRGVLIIYMYNVQRG